MRQNPSREAFLSLFENTQKRYAERIALYQRMESERRSRQRKPVVMVIGDGMQDAYWLAETPTRFSAEAPIPIYKVTRYLTFRGGANNVENCLYALGVEVDPWISDGPVKNRLMIGDVQVARFDESDVCRPLDIDNLYDINVDAIIVSDYGKGAVDETTIKAINDAVENGASVYIDTKRDPRLYAKGAKFFPNKLEASQYAEQYAELPDVVYKLGADGVKYTRGSCPSLAKNIISVNGAGDAVIAAWCYADIMGLEPDIFSMSAAAVACEHAYTYAPSLEETMAIYNTHTRMPKDEASKDASSEAREDTHETK